MTMEDLAHHIIGIAQEKNLPITNLQLQKVMFFSLKDAIINHRFSESALMRIYDKPFLVWRYGPVEKDIYDEYRIYGVDPIIEPNKSNSDFESLNEKIISLLEEDPFELVQQSHDETFWREHESAIDGWRSSVSYSLRDVGEIN